VAPQTAGQSNGSPSSPEASPTSLDDCLTASDAAKRLGVTPSRIRQLCLDGFLPCQKLGRDWFIEEGLELRATTLALNARRSPADSVVSATFSQGHARDVRHRVLT
jgi:hypothetical protein